MKNQIRLLVCALAPLLFYGCMKLDFKALESADKLFYKVVGALDSDFGSAGVLALANPVDVTVNAQSLAILDTSNGEKYEVSTFYNLPSASITKLLADGTIDSSFGTNGRFDVPTLAGGGAVDYIYRAEIFAGRYILFCGTEAAAGAYTGIIGIFDTQTKAMLTTFGGTGVVGITNTDLVYTNSQVLTCTYDSVANTVVGAFAIFDPSYNRKSGLVSLRLDGSMNPAFNGGAPLLLSIAPSTDSVYTSVVRPFSGGYILAGYKYDSGFTAQQGVAALIGRSGSLISSFGTNGILLTNAGDEIDAAVVVGDKIVFGFSNMTYTRAYLRRYEVLTGLLDASYGVAGESDLTPTINTLGASTSWGLNALATSGDGSLIALVYNTLAGIDGIALVKTDPTGQIDMAFGSSGVLGLPHPFVGKNVWGYTLTASPSGPLYASGICFNLSNVRQACEFKVK